VSGGKKATMVRRANRLLGLTAALAAAYALLGAVTARAAVPPTGMICTNGPSFTLRTTSGHIDTPDANTLLMWSYANDATGGTFQLPGPVLCVNEGDIVQVTLNNSLPESSSIVFPGQDNVSASGGVGGGLLAREAPSGGSVTYTFRASQPGTYLYESGTNPEKQVEMGLYGALVVRPAGHADWAYNSSTTQFNPKSEYLILMHDIDPALHHQVEIGLPYDFPALHFRYWTVNGRPFPDSIANNGATFLANQPYGSLVRVKPYDAVLNPLPALIRLANAGLANHPFHPHGFHIRVIAQDGRMILLPGGGDASSEHFGDTIAAGATQDALFKYVDKDKFCSGTSCTATGWSSNPLPQALPSYREMTFRDNQTYYSGSPYLGVKGTLPTLVVSYNVCGEFYFPWHSHALNEFVNYDVPFGGLSTLLRVDPLPGCTGFAASTKIIPTPPNTANSGTLNSGTFANLSADDSLYYSINSTPTATPPAPNAYKTDWYGGFTGVLAGPQNLRLSYKGKCSQAAGCMQSLYIYNWRTKTWLLLDAPRAVGTSDVAVNDLVVPASPAGKWIDWVGTGASAGIVQLRVYTTRTSGSFVSSGNFMKLVYDAP
jgi:hypothetical protein